MVCLSPRADWSQSPLKSPLSELPALSSQTKQVDDLMSYLFEICDALKITAKPFGNQKKDSSFDNLVVAVVVYSFKFEGNIDLKCAKVLYLQRSCVWNIYVLIQKPKLTLLWRRSLSYRNQTSLVINGLVSIW